MRAFANQGTDSWEVSLLGKRDYWRVFSEKDSGNPELLGKPDAAAALRATLKDRFIHLLQPDSSKPMPQSRAILLALLFGDRQPLSQATANLFASATLAHSLALSGQHLAVVGLIGALLVFSAARARPRIYLSFPRKILIPCLALPFALLYLWLGNAPASLLRAFAMLAFAAIWLLRRKPFSGLDLLCAALAAILLCDPLAIFDTGLQMSALCVAVILLTAPALARLLPKPDHERPWTGARKKLLLILYLSLVIQLALLPISLARFQLAGFWFPLNLLWLPCLGLIVIPFAGLGLVVMPFSQPLAALLIVIAELPAQGLLWLLHWLSSHGLMAEPAFLLPHWTVFCAFGLIAASLAWLWGNPKSRRSRVRFGLCLGLLFLLIGPSLRLIRDFWQQPEIEALDVGQGQAILATLPGGIRFLVDGGGSFQDRFDPGKMIVGPLLSANTAPRLTAIINTHPDLDHLGGLFHILEHFDVGQIYENGRDAQKSKAEKWNELREEYRATSLRTGDRITIGNPDDKISLEAMHPSDDKLDGNAASLILRLVKDDKGIALFTGDAEKESLVSCLQANTDPAARLVFAPHHGSDKNLLPAFYEAARPELAIACCGYQNRWRYPGKKLAAWLDSRKIKLLDTGNAGRIRVRFKDWNELEIESVREAD